MRGNGYPVDVLPNMGGLFERLNREGDPSGGFGSITFNSYPAPTGAGTVLGFPSTGVSPGRASFIVEATVFSTTPINGRMQIGGKSFGSLGTGIKPDASFACGPNYNDRMLMMQFIRYSEGPAGTPYISNWLDPAVSGTHRAGGGWTGFVLADSINFDAKKVIAIFGDSLFNGTGPTSVDTCIPWLINKFYRDKGIDSRYILKAYSGSTTVGHEIMRAGGSYDFEKLDLLVYQLGTNDGGQSIATNISMGNVSNFIAWKQARYPKATLLILGPPPLQVQASEDLVANLRNAEATAIAALGDPKVKFLSLGTAFDRSNASNYVSSDGAAGTRIHPGDAGLTQEWAGGYNGFIGLRAWLEANIPFI